MTTAGIQHPEQLLNGRLTQRHQPSGLGEASKFYYRSETYSDRRETRLPDTRKPVEETAEIAFGSLTTEEDFERYFRSRIGGAHKAGDSSHNSHLPPERRRRRKTPRPVRPVVIGWIQENSGLVLWLAVVLLITVTVLRNV